MGSNIAPKAIHLAILETDTPVTGIRDAYGTYGGVFKELFKRACGPSFQQLLKLSFHDVVDHQGGTNYPNDNEIDAILITGSKASAYENLEWIERLVQYTKRVLEGGRIKVIGVCFGHQIIGRALDAKVNKNVRGWELSVVDVALTDEGKRVFQLDTMRIHQMHQDAVLEKPNGVETLAETAICGTQAFYKPGRMISVQGHPEFTDTMVTEILELRHNTNVIRTDLYNDAMYRVENEHDGVRIAQTFMRFLRDEIP